MPAAKKTLARPAAVQFDLPVPFAPKSTRQRAPRKEVGAQPVSPAPALPAPIAPSAVVAQTKPRRRRLAKAFDRPLDKVLKQEAKEAMAAAVITAKAAKATVQDRFTFPKVEHDRLVDLKKLLAEQGVTVKKSDLIRVGLIFALSVPQAKLKSVLAKLPPTK